MTNYEHYQKQIEKFTRMGQKVAVKKDTNEIIPCSDIGCGGCLFGAYDSCTKKSMAWADAEYIEPEEIDWSKVAVDTPILVSNNNAHWHHRYFAKYENGKIYSFYDGKTSWSSNDKFSLSWDYAKLANEN